MSALWQPPLYESTEFSAKATQYCVIVVVLNEGDRLKNQLKRMFENADVADIIIADGGSDDGTVDNEFLKSMRVRSLLVTHEKGLCTAMRMGFAYAIEAGYDGVITVDGNGKDGVEAVPDFVAKLDDGYDMVQGSRFKKGGNHKNTPFERYIGVRFVIAPLVALGGFWYTDPTNGFRAMSMRFLKDSRIQPIRDIFIRFNLQHYVIFNAAKLGFKVIEIPVSRVYPDDGSIPTKITTWKIKWLILQELLATIFGVYDPIMPDKNAK